MMIRYALVGASFCWEQGGRCWELAHFRSIHSTYPWNCSTAELHTCGYDCARRFPSLCDIGRRRARGARTTPDSDIVVKWRLCSAWTVGCSLRNQIPLLQLSSRIHALHMHGLFCSAAVVVDPYSCGSAPMTPLTASSISSDKKKRR
jgi:hypothetical protein